MTKQQLQEKLAFWKEREKLLEERFKKMMQLRGEAAQAGDLSENASFELRTSDAQVTSAQLGQVKKNIKELEKELD